MSKTKRQGLALQRKASDLQQLGTVLSLFGDLPKYKFYDNNRVNFQFKDDESDEEFVVVLSNGLANTYASGKLTKAMCWNLPVYKVTTGEDGGPLRKGGDPDGEIIPHMLVMGTTQQDWQDMNKINKEKISKEVYRPHTTSDFDEFSA